MQKKSWLIVGGLATLFVIIIGGLQWYKWQQLSYNALDLGIYSQTVWSLSQGHGFANSIHDPSYLGDHLELGLIPISWVYRLWAHPLVLLWAQTLILALSAWPLFLLAKRYLGQRLALLATSLWLVHPLLYNAAIYEFHGLVFALPLILWAILGYLEKKYWWWIISLGLLLLVREDMPLIAAGFSLLAIVDRRNWRWWLPIGLAAGAWFIGAQAIISAAQPAGSYKYLAFYGWLGTSYSEIATFPFRHPIVFLEHVFQIRNWLTTLGFLLAFGFLPLLRVRYLLPAAFAYFQLLLAGANIESVMRIHYVIPYLPLLAWASLSGIQLTMAGIRLRRIPKSIAVMLVGLVAVISPIYTHAVFGPAEQPFRPWSTATHTSSEILDWAVQRVHPDDRVLTTFNLLPVFANRSELYSINYIHLGRRQYSELVYQVPTPIDVAVIDWQQYYDFQFLYRDTLYKNQTGADRLFALLEKNDLRLVEWVDTVAIYTRHGESDFTATELLTSNETTTAALELVETPQVTALGPVPAAGVQHQLEVQLDWLNGNRRAQPLNITFQAASGDQIVWETTRVLGIGGPPSDHWRAGERWRTKYRLAVPLSAIGAALTATVESLEGRLRSDHLRRFTPYVKSRERVLTATLGTIPGL